MQRRKHMKLGWKWRLCSAGSLRWPRRRGMMPTGARAQAYPSQDIRLICAFPPGSGADVLVRLFCRKAASDREPHGDRGEQGRRRRQYRDGVCRTGETRRLHHLRPCGDRGCSEPASVQEAARRRSQGVSNRGIDQPATLHAGRRREGALQDRRRAHRGHEEEGGQGHLRDRRRPPAPSWARSTRTSPASKPSR